MGAADEIGSNSPVRHRLSIKSQKLRVSISSLLSIYRYARVAFGVYPRECTLCGFKGSFHTSGMPPRIDSRCPVCSSLERHRLLACFLDERNVITGKSVLHFAPEPSIVALVDHLKPAKYIQGDLFPQAGQVKLNIERLELPESSFDTIICSHVLEHVNDALALGELYRVLKPGGSLLVMIPVIEGWSKTYEDDSIVSAADRTLHFGQDDHVRYYGRDVRERIKGAGFALVEWTASPKMVLDYGLQRGETIFLCQKPKH